MPHIYKCFDTKFRALAFGDLEILSYLGRDIHTYKKVPKKFLFFWVFRNQGVMKRGEMQIKFFSIFGLIALLSVL